MVEEKINCEEVEKKDFWRMLKETSVKDKGLGGLASSLQTDEASVSVSPSDEPKSADQDSLVPEERKEGESEAKEGVRLEEKEPIASLQETEKEVPEKTAGDIS